MAKVKTVRFLLENYELVEFDITDVEYICIDNVSKRIKSHNCSSGIEIKEEYHAYGGAIFVIKAEVKNGRWLDYFNGAEIRKEDHPLYYENLDRLAANDITSVILRYDDDSAKEIWLPWESRTVDDADSILQTTNTNDDGCLEIRIFPNKEEMLKATNE